MSLMMVSMIFIQGSRAVASSHRITAVLNTEVDLNDDDATEKDRQVTTGKVEFRHVGFRYYKKHKNNVLQDITFTANPGEIIGIIGSTGSGKSSLVQLIPRLYDCDEGEVLVDGVNVKEYSLENLRNSVAMVLQKNTLFSGTIMENLRWGDENATDEEVHKMAEAAQADLFVKDFTHGYETELGQGGVNVSGGQKQRLCIARALLKKPKILILDDSTSAVDTATEAKIRQSFSTSLKDTTKLIIAQRISSVEYADRILVMEEGRIVGQGTHDELIKNCDTYKEIYYSQKDKEEVAG
jgi:ATP-binding cassette subfamily B protein